MRSLLLALVSVFSPGNHEDFVEPLATVLESEAPLFTHDDDKRKTAALMVAIGWRESRFKTDAVSKTKDFCAFQLNRRPDLLHDPEGCARVAVAMVRESMRVCPKYPIAWYAAGGRGCTSAWAHGISNDRTNLARWALWKVGGST